MHKFEIEGQGITFCVRAKNTPHPKMILMDQEAYEDLNKNGFSRLAAAATDFINSLSDEEQEEFIAEEDFTIPEVDDGDGEHALLHIGKWIIVPTSTADSWRRPWVNADYITENELFRISQDEAPVIYWFKPNIHAIDLSIMEDVLTFEHPYIDDTCQRGCIISGDVDLDNVVATIIGENKTLPSNVYVIFNTEDCDMSDAVTTFALSQNECVILVVSSYEDAARRMKELLQPAKTFPTTQAAVPQSDTIMNTSMNSLETSVITTGQLSAAEAVITAGANIAPIIPVVVPTDIVLGDAGSAAKQDAVAAEHDNADGGVSQASLDKLMEVGVGGAVPVNHRRRQQGQQHQPQQPRQQKVPSLLKPVGASPMAAKYLSEIALPKARVDGEDFINASRSGKTALGRFLDVNARAMFNYAELGQIASIGALWTFLSTPPEQRSAAQLSATTQPRERGQHRTPGYKVILADATMAKILANAEMCKAMVESTLPFEIFRVDDDGVQQPNTYLSEWYVPALEEIRATLKRRAANIAQCESDGVAVPMDMLPVPNFAFLEGGDQERRDDRGWKNRDRDNSRGDGQQKPWKKSDRR